ncbi:uncharacterized protein RCO7_00686 [Rhynchosporium graminicola]|nr:uncharacterized protein RCO7_00686 [Rhynchosporium commune]
MRFSVLLPLVTLPAALAFGNFHASCPDIAFNYPNLEVGCRDGRNALIPSTYNLAYRLINRNGRLIWGKNPGHAFLACKCTLNHSTAMLGCDCGGFDANIHTDIDLNKYCENKDGHLICAEHA